MKNIVTHSILSDSFIIASFPKSGNTWVRFIIANTYNELQNRFIDINFHNIHEICPELNNDGLTIPTYDNFPYIFKTHSSFTENFKNIILVVRNPWDTLHSYYFYLNHECKISITLEEVILHPDYGINALASFIGSYTSDSNANILLTTYELLHNNSVREIERIICFIGLKANLSNDTLNKVAVNSSFSEMRNIEQLGGRKYGNKDFLFTRSGKIGEGIIAIEKLCSHEINTAIRCAVNSSSLLSNLYGQHC